MLKRLTVAVAALFALADPGLAAGTIPYSLSQQLDEFGKPLSGCKLYIIQAGTVSTPQNAYSDSDLTIPLANPIICNAAGRLPQFFLADGSIKIRLTKSTGVNVVTADGILVVGASGGGGGGSPVDATTILATGDLKARYGTGTLSGFVRANGRTIGSATSGASERANSDTQALFEYLWATDANLTVSTGRGVSANADWVANKTIALPDWRGRALAFLDDMGNTVSGRLTSQYLGASPIVLGSAGGSQSHQLALSETPAGITSSVSIPGLSIPSLSVAGLSVPGLSVPGLSVPGLSVPGLSVPSLSVASLSIPSLSVAVAPAAGFIPVSSDSISSLQTSGSATTNITPANNSGTWSSVSSISGSTGTGSTGTGSTGTGTTGTGTTGTGTTGTGTTGTGTTGTGSTGTGTTGTGTATATSNNTGGGTFAIVNPMMLATIYVKL